MGALSTSPGGGIGSDEGSRSPAIATKSAAKSVFA